MSIKDNLLSEANIGMQINLMIGSKEIFGKILSIDEDSIQIGKSDGQIPTVRLDCISYYEIINDGINNYEDFQEREGKSREFISTEIALKRSDESNNFSENLYKNDTENCLIDLNNFFSKDLFLSSNVKPEVLGYEEIAKSMNDTLLVNTFRSIAESLNYAFTKCHEKSILGYKIQENIAKVKKISEKDVDCRLINDFLGAIYYKCKCDRMAVEAYAYGTDNVSGFAVAEQINDYSEMVRFAVRHFLDCNQKRPYIIRFLIIAMIEANDYSIINLVEKSYEKNQDFLTVYNSVLCAILLHHDRSYKSMLKDPVTADKIKLLFHLFTSASLGSNNKFLALVDNSIDDNSPKTVVTETNNRWKNVDNPFFAKAEYYRVEEKNLNKAAEFYKEAISNNQKPGSAVANLFHIYFSKKKYKECANLLGLYGNKYMREMAYNNLSSQLIHVYPEAKNLLKKIEKSKVTASTEDYFVLAQRADIEENDLQKAINLYKKAIESKQKMSGSVPNLVALYSRLEMVDEAMKLLNDYGKEAMDRSAFLNLKISVIQKSKNPIYKNELDITYSEILRKNTDLEKEIQILISKAHSFLQMGLCEESEKIFYKCIEKCNKFSIKKESISTNPWVQIYHGLLKLYTKKNEKQNALNYARQLLSISPDNKFASSLLKGELLSKEFIETENILPIYHSQYIKNKIINLNLDNEIGAIIKDGIFVDEQERANRILMSIKTGTYKKCKSEEARSNQYYAAAKLIRQILDSGENILDPKIISDEQYNYFISEGCKSYANFRLYRNELVDNRDVPRFLYLQSTNQYCNSVEIPRCAIESILRYVASFFYTVDEIRLEKKIVYPKFVNTDNIFDRTIDSIKNIMQNNLLSDVKTFAIGMIEFLCLHNKYKDVVLELVNNNIYQGKILDFLAKITEEVIPDITSIDDLDQVWSDATVKYYKKLRNFIYLLHKTVDNVFVVGELKSNLAKLKNSAFQALLNNTDSLYIQDLYQIFSKVIRYIEISEFDYKADILSSIDRERVTLLNRIQEYPTYFSYDLLIPEINQLTGKIYKEASALYGNAEPNICVTLASDCSVNEDTKIVLVPISLVNSKNVQNADNVTIKIKANILTFQIITTQQINLQ